MCKWRFRTILPMDSRCKRRSVSQNSTRCTLSNSRQQNGERRCLFYFVWRMRRQNAHVLFYSSFSCYYSRFSWVMWSKLRLVIVQQINSIIWDMIDNCNIRNLAKNQVSAIFYSRTIIFAEVCYPYLQSFVWRRHVGAHPDGHQQGGRKPTETSVTEFCYKSVNLFLEELKNKTLLIFPMQELFRWPNSPK